MKRDTLYISFLFVVLIGCQTTKKTNEQVAFETFKDYELPLKDLKEILSPTSEYVVYEYIESDKKELTQGISTVFVVRIKDDRILYKENLFVDEISWLSEYEVQFRLRSEVVQKSDRVEYLQYNVKTGERTFLKPGIAK